jgi:hypothetical protein
MQESHLIRALRTATENAALLQSPPTTYLARRPDPMAVLVNNVHGNHTWRRRGRGASALRWDRLDVGGVEQVDELLGVGGGVVGVAVV